MTFHPEFPCSLSANLFRFLFGAFLIRWLFLLSRLLHLREAALFFSGLPLFYPSPSQNALSAPHREFLGSIFQESQPLKFRDLWLRLPCPANTRAETMCQLFPTLWLLSRDFFFPNPLLWTQECTFLEAGFP